MASTVVELITADHRDVEGLFDKLRHQRENRPALVAELTAKLLAHGRVEESLVYPELARARPADRGQVHHGAEEHHEAEEKLLELEAADPDSKDFDRVLKDLVKAVTHHVEEEESEILPELIKALSAKRLAELARGFSRGKADLLRDPPRPRGRSKEELLQQAKEKGVEGYSSMTKEELVKALGS